MMISEKKEVPGTLGDRAIILDSQSYPATLVPGIFFFLSLFLRYTLFIKFNIVIISLDLNDLSSFSQSDERTFLNHLDFSND